MVMALSPTPSMRHLITTTSSPASFEAFTNNVTGMGVSWKLWPEHAPRPIQFEWTWVGEQARTYFDLSMIDAGARKRSLTARQEWDGESEQEWQGEDEQEWQPEQEQPQGEEGSSISHPFAAFGMTIQPMRNGETITGEGMCQTVACPAGASGCTAAYNFAEDWSRQHDCPEGTSIRLTLCG